ncbi:MAG: exo-alpha-sialidase [Myxococcales bacterium]|nr:exo-alpha-sialidase [Myxococcales bacterium]
MRRSSLVALALVASFGAARANGRFPSSVSINFRPGDTSDLYLGTTFGFLISHDDGHFRWLCEKNIGYEGTFDPKYRIGADGTIYATTFNGLRVSRDGGCSFATATADRPATDPGYIANIWVDAVDVASNGDVWVATAESARENNVYRSTDGARTFTPTDNRSMQIWWRSIATAPSRPARVYVSGYQVTQVADDGGTTSPAVHLRTSDDAGATWTELPITAFALGGSPLILIEAVSATDPDLLFVRSVRADTPAIDKLYRSTDGGQSFAEVLTTTDAIRGVVIRASGEVLVATQMGGVFRSPDLGQTFAAVPSPPQAACLGDRADQLFACGANWDPDLFSLGRSPDGTAWTKVFRFVEMVGPLECPAGTMQHDQCEALEWPAIREQFGIRPPVDAGVDAPGPRPPGDGGCCQASDAAAPALIIGGAVAAILLRRRRRRACCQ